MSHCIMHFPGDIMSQLMHPPWWHFVPISQFECPYLGQSLRVSRAYLGYILGIFWPYFRHIYMKNIVKLAFFGRQIVPSDKMSHFLPGDKMSQLMHRDVMESCWDILSVVPLCQFEGSAFSEYVLDIFWLHSVFLVFLLYSCSKQWCYNVS